MHGFPAPGTPTYLLPLPVTSSGSRTLSRSLLTPTEAAWSLALPASPAGPLPAASKIHFKFGRYWQQ